MTPEQIVLLRHMRRDGSSIRECAAAFGVSKSKIHRHVREMGSLAPRLPIRQIAQSIKPYGFVYVFAAQSLVKIGMTGYSVYRRWHSIKTANPWLERPLYVTPPLHGRARDVEKSCHKELSAYHRCGEWFECERQVAIDIVQKLARECLK